MEFFRGVLNETFSVLSSTPSFVTADEMAAFTTPLTGFGTP